MKKQTNLSTKKKCVQIRPKRTHTERSAARIVANRSIHGNQILLLANLTHVFGLKNAFCLLAKIIDWFSTGALAVVLYFVLRQIRTILAIISWLSEQDTIIKTGRIAKKLLNYIKVTVVYDIEIPATATAILAAAALILQLIESFITIVLSYFAFFSDHGKTISSFLHQICETPPDFELVGKPINVSDAVNALNLIYENSKKFTDDAQKLADEAKKILK